MGTEEFVSVLRRMLREERASDILHAFVEKFVGNKVAAERAEIATLMMELDIDTADSAILAASSRGGPQAAGVAGVQIARRALIDLVLARVERENYD